MLKDITLGQYFPGDSFIHKLDPRTKLLCVILYIVALFCADSVLTYAMVAAVLALSIIVSGVKLRALTKGLRAVYIIVIFTAILNLFFTAAFRPPERIRRVRLAGTDDQPLLLRMDEDLNMRHPWKPTQAGHVELDSGVPYGDCRLPRV